MANLEDSLLRLRARMVIKQVERKLRFRSEDERRTGLSIRAYYLGREYPNARTNPFSQIEHPFRDDLVKGFSDGTSNVTSHIRREQTEPLRTAS
ncbi:MAG: hypothetical protein G8D91_22355 [gamma proteobacterium symbiont of Clathrolucina costata]